MTEPSNMSLSICAASTTILDAVVVGAGPYGLSTAAYLEGYGLKIAVFGKPLQLWSEGMPENMLLRSVWWATSFSAPNRQYNLAQYFREINEQPIDPLSVKTIREYGSWFQKRVIPDIDETFVQTITRKERQFEVTLVDGRVVYSRAVVLAPGLCYYTYRPGEYDHFPSELVSHTSEHYTFDQFLGKQVVVIGGGQSALETAALLNESGAYVHVVSRRPIIWIPDDASHSRNRPLLERLRHPNAGIAPGWFNWGLERFPYMFQKLPRSVRKRILHGPGSYGPMGASWLKPRIVGWVNLHESQRVEHIKEVGGAMMIKLSDDSLLKADHVILGTGYRIDIKKLPMLHPSLLSEVQNYQNAPILNNRFESSVAGLYFIGFSSVPSNGPLYRFVIGTEAAARRVASSIAQQKLPIRK